jgi:hypothetical protein
MSDCAALTLEPGTWVTFVGGIAGRDESDALEGVVNGDPWTYGPDTFVPVHVPHLNQNVQVHGHNITSPESAVCCDR